MIVLLGILLAAALAAGIGANNAGVHLAPAFGAGVRSRRASLALFAVFAFLGAALLGGRVVRTLGQGLFSTPPAGGSVLLLAPAVTLALLSLANRLRLPVPTTPLAVASLAGVGLYLDVLRLRPLLEILAWWVATPVAALALTWAVGKAIPARRLAPGGLSPAARRRIGILLTIEGAYSAFAIGSNNVANAMAPLVGGGTMDVVTATLAGGLAMGAGALLWGGGVLETVGKEITELCHVRALVVGSVASTALILASLYGAPVSGACIVTAGVVGFSLAVRGARETASNRAVRRIALLWAGAPALAIGVAYVLGALLR